MERPDGSEVDSRVSTKVGEPWPKIGAHFRELSESRSGSLRILLLLCVVLLIAITVYGMVKGDQGIVDTVLTLVRDVVIAILGWTIGRYRSH